MRKNRKEYVKTNKQNNPLPCPKINRINPVVPCEKKTKLVFPKKKRECERRKLLEK